MVCSPFFAIRSKTLIGSDFFVEFLLSPFYDPLPLLSSLIEGDPGLVEEASLCVIP
jgi:hypothetical protein